MLKRLLLLVVSFTMVLALVCGGWAAWYLYSKQPVRKGTVPLQKLKSTVSVRYDERGVPHIRADHEADAYRALGYVHAQDRLFQMEMLRRLAQGELAEILGPKLLASDKLMRTLGIRHKAEAFAQQIDPSNPSHAALLAYLDGINQYQAQHKPPLEFDLLHIPQRPFTPQDSAAVTGYLAYSFANALKTEPVLTHIRNQLGPNYLRIFGIEPSVATSPTTPAPAPTDPQHSAITLSQALAQIGDEAQQWAPVPRFDGSNAWAISGRRTASGKPILAGDPHIQYSIPAVWYEAHLSAPGLELYGHHHALLPVALLGHNSQFGWSLTMLHNDDMDLVAETTNPANPQQVWYQGQWVDLQTRTETIAVKGRAPVTLTLRSSPHGPILNDALPEAQGERPIALWWTYLATDNSLIDAFYALNRADTLDKARSVASSISAPGLNIVWANAQGHIAWWAAARLAIRPDHVDGHFILDAAKGEADKKGYYLFAFNPHEENPARGYVVSANQAPNTGVPVAGYYSLADRAEHIAERIDQAENPWDMAATQVLQRDVDNPPLRATLDVLLPLLKEASTDAASQYQLRMLETWDTAYGRDSLGAPLYTQLLFEIARAAMADELPTPVFKNLLQTRAIDSALLQLIADEKSPWWDDITTPNTETRADTIARAWRKTMRHLDSLYASSPQSRAWGKTHTLTFQHPLSRQSPLNWILDIGPFPVAGSRNTVQAHGQALGPAPWKVTAGPSTRRIIDFGNASKAIGINPLGQSGVPFDRHYADQTPYYIEGLYMPQHLDATDIQQHTRSTLTFRPDFSKP